MFNRCFAAVLAALLLLTGLPLLACAEETPPEIVEIDIGIAPGDYDRLIADQQKHTYRVSVEFAGGASGGAQINSRGYSSRILGQRFQAKRIPFELNFARDDRFPLLANKKIKLINSLFPYRLFAEYLGLELFSAFGVPTPAHAFTFVKFNGVDTGLYLAVEDLDRGFLRKHYGSAETCALYKATADSGKNAEYVNSSWFGQMFQKVKGPSENFTLLQQALDRGEGYEAYINTDEWLRYFACLAVTGGEGSVFTEKNNFALYDNNGRFELIPWDISEAFAGQPSPNGIDRFYLQKDTRFPSALFDLIMANPENRETYHGYIRQAAEEFLQPERIDAVLAALAEAAAPYLKRDHSMLLNTEDVTARLLSDAPDSYACLKWALHGIRENLLAQLDGKETVFFENTALRRIYTANFTTLIEPFEAESPLYDPKLPDKIRAAYNGGGGEKKTTALLIPLIGCAAAICVVFAVKKKRAAE